MVSEMLKGRCVFALDDLPDGDQPRSWIQVLIAGEFKHPVSGEFKITRQDLEAAAADISARADRIPIDLDHKSAHGETRAAGWYTGQTEIRADAQNRDALFAEVEWTPLGAASVRSKEYRFISPEFNLRQWRDTAGKVVKGFRMWATALTNRPFLPEMAAVELSTPRDENPEKEEPAMAETTTNPFAVALGLSADADEAAILAAIQEQKQKADKATTIETRLGGDLDVEKLVASAAKGEQAAKELHDMRRDTLLSDAVRDGKILPVQKDHYAAMYDASPDAVAKLLDATPAKTFKPTGSGSGTDDGAGDGLTEIPASVRSRFAYSDDDTSRVTLDEDSARLHVAAEKILADQGKRRYTEDEYLAAIDQARAAV